MATSFFGGAFFGGEFFNAAVVTAKDTHDGGRKKPWRQRIEYSKEAVDERALAYRQSRERLRADIVSAMDGPAEPAVLDVIREHLAPEDHVALAAPDYEPELRGLLSQTEALRELAALVIAEERRREDEDEETVELLLLH